MAMTQALQAQMQDLLRKGTIDQLCHEEDQRKQEEERRRQTEEMAQLKEHNKTLLQRLEESEREGHPRAPTHQFGTKIPTP